MKFKGKSIRSLSRVLKTSGDTKHVRLAVFVEDVSDEKRIELGFNKTLNIGDSLMPSDVGKFTRFNAKGKEIINKDLPKTSESIMCFGTTRDWHGGMHSSIQTRTIKKHQRDYVEAPSELLQIIDIEGSSFIASSELNLDDVDETRNVHVCNIMLECFNQFDIFDIKSKKIVGPKLKQLQWDVLPKGSYPWLESKSFMQAAISRLAKNEQEVIEHRMKVISRYSPDFIATGRGGFSGYFVYGFESKGKYVLESIHLDNATYVFESDWENLSKLTKNEIINSEIMHRRVIHNKVWPDRVARAINKM